MVTDQSRWPRSVGGHVALDLVNTGVHAQDDPTVDVLRSPGEFLAWCRHEGVPVPDAVDPAAARGVIAPATRLRAALRAVVEAMVEGQAVPADALAAVRSAYADAVTRSRPAVDDGHLTWQHDPDDPASVVDRLAVAAVDLLRAGPTDQLKACPSCRFVFLDATKNHSRRWCSMEDCGKDAKIRRYVARRAEARRGAPAG